MKLSGGLPRWGSLKMKLFWMGMATVSCLPRPFSENTAFSKKCPKNLTNFVKFKKNFYISCCNFIWLFNGISFVFILLVVWAIETKTKIKKSGVVRLYSRWKNDAYLLISRFTFWFGKPKVLRVWKQTMYHWKTLYNCNKKCKKKLEFSKIC